MHAAQLLLLLRLLNPVNTTYICEGDAQEECYQWRDWPDEGLREPAAYSAAPCPLPNLHHADLALDDVKHARPDTTCTPFYLNEDGAFDMSILQACWEHAHELTPNSRQVDNRVNPERAQHVSDLHLLQQLRSHPARVWDPNSTKLHFTGLTPLISLYVSEWEIPCPTGNSHASRMQLASQQLSAELNQLGPLQDRIYVIINSHYGTQKALGDIYHLMATEKGRRHLLYANSDLSFSRPWNDDVDGWRNLDLTPNHLTIPYVATSVIDDAAHDPSTTCDPSRRDVSFFFAGTMRRSGNGAGRAHLLRAMELVDPDHSLIVDLVSRNSWVTTYGDWSRQVNSYSSRLLRSRFCIVPAGDTATSRRLYDAMSAGCVPVFLGPFLDNDVDIGGKNAPSSIGGIDPHSGQNNLPFRGVLNWSAMVMFAGSMSCALENTFAGAKVLAKRLKDLHRTMSDEEFRSGCESRLDAYRQALSYAPPTTKNVAWHSQAPGKYETGVWGGICTCPDGQKYPVADKMDYCGSVACDGGQAGACQHETGPWDRKGATCSASKAADHQEGAASALLVEVYRVRKPDQLPLLCKVQPFPPAMPVPVKPPPSPVPPLWPPPPHSPPHIPPPFPPPSPACPPPPSPSPSPPPSPPSPPHPPVPAPVPVPVATLLADPSEATGIATWALAAVLMILWALAALGYFFFRERLTALDPRPTTKRRRKPRSGGKHVKVRQVEVDEAACDSCLPDSSDGGTNF